MTTQYKYTGDILGNFKFEGTITQFKRALRDLKKVAPDFTGEITEHTRRDGTKTLHYLGEEIAEEKQKRYYIAWAGDGMNPARKIGEFDSISEAEKTAREKFKGFKGWTITIDVIIDSYQDEVKKFTIRK
jgi:hypothetical protein